MLTPHISICIPTYNQGDYILDCLLSLSNQSTLPHEIVISENHSTDNTNDVIQRFIDEHPKLNIKKVRPEKHIGMVENFQFCALNASGSWLAFMTSDDLAMVDYVQKLRDGVEKYPDAVVIRAGHFYMNSVGEIVSKSSLLSVPKVSNKNRAFREQIGGPKAFFEATVFRRDAWESIEGFNLNLKLFGDWGLWIELSKVGSFAKIDGYISAYRLWDGVGRGISRLENEMLDEMYIYEGLIYPRCATKLSLRRAKQKARTRGCANLQSVIESWDEETILAKQDLLLKYCQVMNVQLSINSKQINKEVLRSTLGNYSFGLKAGRFLSTIRKSIRTLIEH